MGRYLSPRTGISFLTVGVRTARLVCVSEARMHRPQQPTQDVRTGSCGQDLIACPFFANPPISNRGICVNLINSYVFLFFIKNRCCLYINIAIQKILSRKNDILPPRRVHFKHPFKKQNYSQNNSLTNSY